MDTKNYERPIFIFGCPRSGTSLLSKLLNSHPRIAVPFESHVYKTFYHWLKYYGDLNLPKNRERLLDDIFSTGPLADWSPYPNRENTIKAIQRYDFHGIFEAIMFTWAKDRGKQRWGEKTPAHLFYWREILNGFPNLQVIHIVRDGRDCALSWLKSRMGPKHIYLAAWGWVKHLEVIEELKILLAQNSFFEVRYEKLLLNPQQVLKQMCAFLVEEYTPEMLNFYKDNAPYRTDKQNLQNLSRPIISSNTEKWRTQMTERQLRIFEAVAGPTLERYSYQRELAKPQISNLERLQFQYIEHPLRKFLAMMKNRKGQIEALQELKIYLNLRLGLNSPTSLYKSSLMRNL
ncbi:MAG: sulfotransferase [Okeania sp. SIO2C9]|uniref:sulfotransferase family protein n=1 Tax=Okeania sp. SIO2C9 TaxID=2607791 RepID=UPI0013C1AF85|nr:sulfotransferase [Okeania sp. SIO2C9]NEQ76179.1 sulfotransferase [Okeania sp. SIO2C9]